MRLKQKYGLIKSKNNDVVSEEGAWVLEQDYIFSYSSPKTADVILDTGATRHIFHDKSLFTSILPIKKSVQTASGHLATVSGIGQVNFIVYDMKRKDTYKTTRLEDVWYLPTCTKNLVSGSQIISRGYAIKTNEYGLGIYSSNESIIATARPVNGLFYFNTSNSRISLAHSPSDLPEAFMSQDEKESATYLLHRRFAHFGINTLKKNRGFTS